MTTGAAMHVYEVIGMARKKGPRTNAAVETPPPRAATSLPNGPANVTERDIARRAYERYLARDGEHGHDIEDWLQAERELRDAGRARLAGGD